MLEQRITRSTIFEGYRVLMDADWHPLANERTTSEDIRSPPIFWMYRQMRRNESSFQSLDIQVCCNYLKVLAFQSHLDLDVRCDVTDGFGSSLIQGTRGQ